MLMEINHRKFREGLRVGFLIVYNYVLFYDVLSGNFVILLCYKLEL